MIKELLNLVQVKKGKDTNTAANIMYVCGQYPQFLKKHSLKQSLFEIMHESHQGVQDMACDTFIAICESQCRSELVIPKEDELPFIEQVLLIIPNIISDLNTKQICSVYPFQLQERYVQEFYKLINQPVLL